MTEIIEREGRLIEKAFAETREKKPYFKIKILFPDETKVTINDFDILSEKIPLGTNVLVNYYIKKMDTPAGPRSFNNLNEIREIRGAEKNSPSVAQEAKGTPTPSPQSPPNFKKNPDGTYGVSPIPQVPQIDIIEGKINALIELIVLLDAKINAIAQRMGMNLAPIGQVEYEVIEHKKSFEEGTPGAGKGVVKGAERSSGNNAEEKPVNSKTQEIGRNIELV